MKIALIGGGQPRFTQEFFALMNQLTGFDQADIYFNFWTSPWVSSEEEGRKRIESILLPKYRLAKLKIVDQPAYTLPPHKKYHPPESYPNVHWAYKRRLGMWQSTQMAFNLIEGKYDAVLKVRPDGMLTNVLDVSKLDLKNNELIFPNSPRNGRKGKEICDQFVVGTHEGLHFYSSLADKIQQYVPEVCSFWEDDIHEWASEHMLAHHLEKHGKVQVIGNFGVTLAGLVNSLTHGRSPFTDNHYHHPVIKPLI